MSVQNIGLKTASVWLTPFPLNLTGGIRVRRDCEPSFVFILRRLFYLCLAIYFVYGCSAADMELVCRPRASGSLAGALLCHSGQESGLGSPLPTLPSPTSSVHVLTHPPSTLPEELCRFHNPFHWGNYMQTFPYILPCSPSNS